MEDVPRRFLREIILNRGVAICNWPNQLEGLLKDYCPSYKKEIFLLMCALRSGIVEQLINRNKYVDIEILIEKLIVSIKDNLGLDHNSSRWAVECWAWALGHIEDCKDHGDYKEIHNKHQYGYPISYNQAIKAYNKAMEIRGI